jgi:V/A-type H+-transporting ATPase subunit K
VKSNLMAKIALMAMVVMVGMFAFAPATFAQEHGEEVAAAADGGSGLGSGLIAIGAGLAVGLAGLATGNAQAGVGAGGTGAIAEKPEVFTNVLILFAIPETIVILGFVIAFLLLGNI